MHPRRVDDGRYAEVEEASAAGGGEIQGEVTERTPLASAEAAYLAVQPDAVLD